MSALINIAKDDAKPLLIDPSDITALRFYKGEESDNPVMILYTSQGELDRFGLKGWNLEADDVIGKLRDAGVPLAHCPERWPSNDEEGKFDVTDCYVNPHAVTFATIRAPGKNGNPAVLAGVSGAGWLDSNNNTATEVNELISAVRAVKTLLEYKPEQAYSRWFMPGALYIDPKSVTRIRDNPGNQIDITFLGRSGSLDVKVAQGRTASEFYKTLPRPESVIEPDGTKVTDWTANQKEADRLEEQERQAKHLEIINAILRENKNLISIPNPTAPVCITREDIGYAHTADDRGYSDKKLLYIEPQKTAASPYKSNIIVWFNTAAEVKKALGVLQKAKASPAARQSNPW